MKPIETQYHGHRFRSRLEARWAVFFDTLGIEYWYEHEGFDLDGLWYLPDFWLPQYECWIEIKPELLAVESPEFNQPVRPMMESEDINKAERLARFTEKPVFIFGGDIAPFEVITAAPLVFDPQDIELRGARALGVVLGEHGEWKLSDSLHMWTECRQCHCLAISWLGDATYAKTVNACLCRRGSPLSDIKTPRLLAAYRAARSARFEGP
jgi:hypothetical protein